MPEISTVGLTEAQAREKGIGFEVGIARFREISRGHIMGLESGLMKLIFALRDAHVCSACTSSARAPPSSSISARPCSISAARLDYFVENTFNYPTLAEGYKVASLDAYNRMGPR